MNNVPDTPTIINVAIISQYKAVQDIRNSRFSGNQVLNKTLPNLLRTIRKCVQNTYNINPSDPALTATGEYLFGLCAPYSQYALGVIANQSQVAPVITGPTNQSVNAGQNATFTISVVSALPYTIQWYDTLGNPIPGATGLTYTVLNAQQSQSGNTYFAVATNAVSPAVSNTAILTVTAVITGFFAYMDADPGPNLIANLDPFIYQVSFNITHNSPLTITLPAPSTPNKYLIVKAPIGEPVKTIWFNTSLNNGTIPDFVWQTLVQFGGFTYYYTRAATSMDISQTLILS